MCSDRHSPRRPPASTMQDLGSGLAREEPACTSRTLYVTSDDLVTRIQAAPPVTLADIEDQGSVERADRVVYFDGQSNHVLKDRDGLTPPTDVDFKIPPRPAMFSVPQPKQPGANRPLYLGVTLVCLGLIGTFVDIGMTLVEATIVVALFGWGLALICRWSRS